MSFRKNLGNALTNGFRGYFNFKGVASRRDYWLWVGVTYLVILTLPQFSGLLIIPTIAYSVRRMHDVGRSAWWLLFGPAALFFSLKPSVSVSMAKPPVATTSTWFSMRIADTQAFFKTAISKFESMRNLVKSSSTKTAVETVKETRLRGSKDVASPKAIAPDPTPHVVSKAPKRAKKTTGSSDIDVLINNAQSLGLATDKNDSVVETAQSLVRHIWSQVRTQQEADPLHSDYLRLAIRALAEFGLNDSKASDNKSIERAKALLWYGILLSLLSSEDNAPTTFGERAVLRVSDALRSACKMFEAVNDQKMAARCMEELGQFGRLINRADLTEEGFNEAIKLFDAAGATERSKQAMTNSGVNFQRHSSAFFDGGQHSLKATTILGSSQCKRLRETLHHID